MKYLKKFNEGKYEDDFNNFKNLLQNLEDYCLEFKDSGLNVDITPKSEVGKSIISMRFGSHNGISVQDTPFWIGINKRDESKRVEYFDWREFTSTIESIVSLMDENGFETVIEFYRTTSNTHRSQDAYSVNLSIANGLGGGPGPDFKLKKPYFQNIFKIVGFKLIFNIK